MTTMKDLFGLVTSASGTQQAWAAGLLAMLLLVLVVVARKLKLYKLATLGTVVVVGIVLGTTIDGAVKFAHHVLHVSGFEAVFPAVVFESVAIAVAGKARDHAQRYHQGPGVWGGRLYLVGMLAGLIVATGATSPGAVAFRFAMPIIGVWLVILELTDDSADKPEASTTWRWTPRRLAILLGAIEPGDHDLGTVHRALVVKRMASLRHRIDRGGPLTEWRRSRLCAMALRVDDTIIAEVRANVTRAVMVETLTAPVRPAQSTGTPDQDIVDAPDGDPVDEQLTPDSCHGSKPVAPRRGSGHAVRVRRLAGQHPDASISELATLAGVSRATVRKYRPTGAPDTEKPPERVNGTPVPALVGPVVAG